MSDFRLPPSSADERVYRGLLRLYPADFRLRFEREMTEAFRDERRAARREGRSSLAFWSSLLPDLLIQAAAERLAPIAFGQYRAGSLDDEDSIMAALPHALRFDEIRLATRRLLRAPTFTAATLVVLALGIGATTAVFSLVDGVVLRPLPYPEPDRLVDLSHSLVVPGVTHADQSDATFLLYERHNTVFSGIAATRDADVTLGGLVGSAPLAERVVATGASASLFSVLRVAPLLGRAFAKGEDRVGAPPVVILSEALWRRRFGGDSTVLGKRLMVNGEAREIVGVMPAGFRYPSSSTALWTAIRFDPSHANAGSFNYKGVARLAPGVTREGAAAELERLLPRLLDEFPGNIPRAMFAKAEIHPLVKPVRDVLVGDVQHLLWILFGAVGLVLLIACANVANLFLVRGESRHRELAVRSALGAGLPAVLAQYVSEALLLALGGGALGTALAALAVHLLRATPHGLDLPRLEDVSIDGRVMLFALLVSVGTAVAVSLIPLLRARRLPIASVLRESGRSATTGGQRQRTRSMLVVAQVALALVLVASSGLLARSFAHLRNVKPGFDANGVYAVRVALPRTRYATAAARMQFYEQLLAAARSLPAVREVALTSWLPLTSNHNDTVIEIEDQPLPAGTVPRDHDVSTVTGSYFVTMGVPLLTGRSFGTQDPAHAEPEAVVSRAFAERYWKGSSAIGKRIRPGIGGPWYEIIGVAGDVHLTALDAPAEDAVYLPVVTVDDGTPSAPSGMALVVRTAGDPGALAALIRRAVQSLDPTLPAYDETVMTSVVAAASARTRFTMLLLVVASVLALLLGAVGIYGVMAYGVSLRRREIGVRMALGARPADVRQMISRQGVTLAAVGVLFGLAGALATTRFLRGLLYEVSPTDPVTLVGTCAVLLGVALVASWIPAQRAAGMDAAVALRSD